MTLTISPAGPDELSRVMWWIGHEYGSPLVVSRMVRHRSQTLPSFVAWRLGDPVGIATYHLAGDECEVVTLDAVHRREGIGTALMQAIVEVARERSCRRLWMMTTNENTSAMAFARHVGLRQARVLRGSVDHVRTLRPWIPKAVNGVRVSDEHEFELMLQPQHDDAVLARVGAIMKSDVVASRGVLGGYTQATRLLASLASGQSVFVKSGAGPDLRQWLRAEERQYQRGLKCMPEMLGFEDGADSTTMIIEDLGGRRWPPPWRSGDVTKVLRALDEVHSEEAPELPSLAQDPSLGSGWRQIAEDPTHFCGLNLCTRAWLETSLPALVAAEASAELGGDRLLHMDVRSDNLCLDDEGATIIDWNWACRGNPETDIAFWAPSLSMEGGPPPWELLPDAPELAALVSGFFASRAGQPAGDIPHRVRHIQQAQLIAALPWVSRALGLGPVHDRT